MGLDKNQLIRLPAGVAFVVLEFTWRDAQLGVAARYGQRDPRGEAPVTCDSGCMAVMLWRQEGTLPELCALMGAAPCADALQNLLSLLFLSSTTLFCARCLCHPDFFDMCTPQLNTYVHFKFATCSCEQLPPT